MRSALLFLFFALGLLVVACNPGRRTTSSNSRPNPSGKPSPGKPAPIDTIRWTPNTTGKPPIGSVPGKPGDQPGPALGETYHIGLLLPFLSNQMTDGSVPEKSRLAVQFYAGAKIALEQLSKEERINLVADVWDTQANDADFQKLMTNQRLAKSSVFIGPIRSSHVQAFAEWTKEQRKILISPESPSMDLTRHNAGFIQINPSLEAHCEVITDYVRKKRRHSAEDVVLICKEKEAERLVYFQNANLMYGSTPLSELVLPDATANFDKVDLKKYLRAGRTTVFILPTWSSQDFVMAFLRKLKDIKGSNEVEVYGMPQWRNFEAIDPEYLSSLNVHISTSSWIDFTSQEVKDFQQQFYTATGTIPDDDGFNGYDVTLFTGRMLAKYGLSFPERLDDEQFQGLRSALRFFPVVLSGDLDDRRNEIDYLENKVVYILKFDKFGFVPVD